MDEGRWSPASKTQYNLIDAVSRCTTHLRPNFADAWSNLAGAYVRKGRLSEAAQCWRQALALNPRLVDAHSNLGNKMKAQGLVQEALHIQPTFVVAWSNLASLFMDAGDLNRALQYYKEAVKLKKKFTDAYLNMGNVYKLSRNFSTSPSKQQTILLELPEFWTFFAAYLGLDLGVLSWIFTCRFPAAYWNNLSYILG